MNAEQTKHILKNLPVEKSIMLRAKHGVGKSSVVRQAADELGINFFDVRLSQCEVGDIKGLPFLNAEKEITSFLKPYWWPRDKASKGFLFFDELNRANKDVLQAVFEICLDRRLDGESLPAGWRVVTAINAEDDYDVVELDPALLDRWFVIDFDPSAKEWIKWAYNNSVHTAVVEFVDRNQNLLDPPVGNLESGKVYPSRRSWVSFSSSLQAMNLLEGDPGILSQVAKGWLGTEISIMFQKFVEKEFSQLRPEDVLDKFDKVKKNVEKACSDIEVIAALARSVVQEVITRPIANIKDTQKDALREFFMMLPSDVGSQMWVSLLENNRTKKIVIEWQGNTQFDAHLKKIYMSGS